MSDTANEKIYEAVEYCIDANMSVTEFLKSANAAWVQIYTVKIQHVEDNFRRLLETKGVY
jgi:hypothetical protein